MPKRNIETIDWAGILAGVLACVLIAACSKDADHSEIAAPHQAKNHGGPQPLVDTALLGEERSATLTALRATLGQRAKLLGSQRLSCQAQLTTKTPSFPVSRIAEDINLRLDGKGQYWATKNTGPQYGQEVVWTGGWLYPRQRYSKFTKRRPRSGEPTEIANRLCDHLAAYSQLLERFIEFDRQGEENLLGRTAIVVKLSLSHNPEPPRDEGEDERPARRWRRTIAARQLNGRVWFDRQTGAVLQADLQASWEFNPPLAEDALAPTSGIPTKIDEKTVSSTELKYTQRVNELGWVTAVAPPPADQIVENVQRLRPEIERQILLGEAPFPEGQTRLGK